MSRKRSLAEVKASFSECIREVEKGENLLITRHGKVVAALVSVDDIEHVERLRAAGPQAGLVSLAGGWAESEELIDLARTARRSCAREGEELE